MGKLIVGMTMSLDGFVNDRAGSVEQLYPDFDALRESQILQESMGNTGAVLMGRHTFDMGEPDSYADTYEYQVPIFVLTHEPPRQQPRQNDRLTFTFINAEIEQAIAQAKAAAGDKDVTVVGGASTVRQCLRAGLVDELHVDIMPLLLTGGVRLFDQLGERPIHLEKLEVSQVGLRTMFRFRVLNSPQ
jgi:dihydrofolate reductase